MRYIMNSDCIHCNIYFLSRENIISRKKKIYEENIIDLYPINYKCTNIYCNTIKELKTHMKEETAIKKEQKINFSEEGKMDTDNPKSYNSDNENNYDIETPVKVFRKRKRRATFPELHRLFKNINISKKNKIKKKKRLKQLKITDFDINNLFNNLNI